jgi:hypothetical protein
LFFLILIFHNNLWNQDRFYIGSVWSDLDLLASCGLAVDVKCDRGIGSRFQAHINRDFVLVLVIDHVYGSLARLKLLITFDLNFIDTDRDVIK